MAAGRAVDRCGRRRGRTPKPSRSNTPWPTRRQGRASRAASPTSIGYAPRLRDAASAGSRRPHDSGRALRPTHAGRARSSPSHPQLRAATGTHVAGAAARARHAVARVRSAVRSGAARFRPRVRAARPARARYRVRHGRDHCHDGAVAARHRFPRRSKCIAPGVGRLLNRIDEGGLANVRVMKHDAVEVVAVMIPPASLSGVHVFFPDPWPKKRHHKRRLLTPRVRARARPQALDPGGHLHVATDWEEYAQEVLATLCAEAVAREHGGQFRAATRLSSAHQVRGARPEAWPRRARPRFPPTEATRSAQAPDDRLLDEMPRHGGKRDDDGEGHREQGRRGGRQPNGS